jgi:hypothetical protein
MSMTYVQRRAVLERVLVAEDAKAADGKTLSDLATKLLYALDSIKETVR